MREYVDDTVLYQHLWGGGYFCSCGHELNSPVGFNRHLIEAWLAATQADG